MILAGATLSLRPSRLVAQPAARDRGKLSTWKKTLSPKTCSEIIKIPSDTSGTGQSKSEERRTIQLKHGDQRGIRGTQEAADYHAMLFTEWTRR